MWNFMQGWFCSQEKSCPKKSGTCHGGVLHTGPHAQDHSEVGIWNRSAQNQWRILHFAKNNDLFGWGHFESLAWLPGIADAQFEIKITPPPPGTGMVLPFSSEIDRQGTLFCWYQIQQEDANQLRYINSDGGYYGCEDSVLMMELYPEEFLGQVHMGRSKKKKKSEFQNRLVAGSKSRNFKLGLQR
jgi:hypothetical protein